MNRTSVCGPNAVGTARRSSGEPPRRRSAADSPIESTRSLPRFLWRRWHAIAVAIVVTTWLAPPAHALDIEETVWGFDGEPVIGEFNPFSVLVSNYTPDLVDIRLRLQRVGGTGPVGARIDERVSLSPNSTRWVQFYPYVTNEHDSWRVSWGLRPSQGVTINLTGVTDEPARILLESTQSLSPGSSGGMKRFDEGLFPPMVAATAGLESVVLDHVPRWTESRRRAFLDWLQLGGTLELLQTANGAYPTFPEDLSVLNSPLDEFRVGVGLVRRHALSRAEIGADHFQSLRTARSIARDPGDEEEDNNADSNSYQQWNDDYGQFDMTLFEHLRRMTQVDHNWLLIHALSWVYFLWVFPGIYLLNRRRLDFRLGLLAFLVLVSFVSLCFHAIGRRGYGESTTMHMAGIARPIGNSGYEVRHWSDAFVTRGGDYAIAHDGDGRLYSSAQSLEPVRGIIDNGLSGGFYVEIPPFSSRPFVSRSRVDALPFPVSIASIEIGPNQRIEELEISIDESFPEVSMDSCFAVHGRNAYQFMRQNDRLVKTQTPEPIERLMTLEEFWQQRYYPAFGRDGESIPIEDQYEELRSPLVMQTLDRWKSKNLRGPAVPADQVVLYVYAPMPKEFYVHAAQFPSQMGYVLYEIPLLIPQSP